ncbi:ATP-dependent nuclease [Streptococcus tangpeifui]|uniref:ATP-dependent nuclease n=1 Tax=Streptococcus tangpeifui TaxID=2709400 RepID=UPI0013EA2AF5|nr:AAA family ATPase [Streptococcus sp. ZJ373]
MYISKITLENFRCFEGKTDILLNSGINFFVGDNNAGKTTIFKAVEFIKSGKQKEDWITKNLSEDAEVSVELELKGDDVAQLLGTDKLKKYQSYLVGDDKLILKRSSKESTWTDSKGKEKNISLKNITFYNPETKVFENPSGIDTVLSSLFDTQFVYSDLKNEDYQGFGKTNIAGRLISDVTEQFKTSPEWQKLEEAHSVAFGTEGLAHLLSEVQSRVQGILNEQYGEAKVEFNFGLPTLDNFFKNGNILLEENGIKTDVSEKGTGMQRALALSLIQVYADIDIEGDTRTPLFFFIDEPETFLHPQAQDKLLNSLEKISTNSQIFITTHSPYLLRSYKKGNHKLYIFSRKYGEERMREDNQIGILPYSPSWGEINYFAFKVASPEFHNELFGELHNLARSKNKTFENGSKTVGKGISCFDTWLSERSDVIPTDLEHVNFKGKVNNSYQDKTMTSYIRNYIDHPGDYPDGQPVRKKPTIEEIKDSIEFMLKVYESELK